MPKCPECNKEREVLVGCTACPLICCYQCAAENTEGMLARPCERAVEKWQERRKEGISRNGPPAYTNKSPYGHIWGAA